MSQTSDPPEGKQVDYAAISAQALTVGGEVGCLTLIIVLVSLFGGLWLDRLLGTKPLLTIFLVIASAPLALGLTIWIAKRAVEKKTPGNSPELMLKKGDKTGE